MRLTLRCAMATMLPKAIVSTARTAIRLIQSSRIGPRPWTRIRIIAANPAAFGPDRHEGGDRRRRAVVGVRRPHVERHGRDLEAEADDEQQQRQQQRGSRQPVAG